MKQTSDILKELREDNDLKQSDLSKEFNISRSAIASYESGNTVPSVEILIKYAEKFNTSVDYLLGRVKEKNWTISKTDKLEITHTTDLEINSVKLKLLEEFLEDLKVNNLLEYKE